MVNRKRHWMEHNVAIKLEWMYRYIIWLEMGFPKNKLDAAIAKEIKSFEDQFPQLIY